MDKKTGCFVGIRFKTQRFTIASGKRRVIVARRVSVMIFCIIDVKRVLSLHEFSVKV